MELIKDFWTDKLFENVKNNKIELNKCVVTIPSYNKCNDVKTIKNLFANMTPEENYEVYVITRESQKEDYEKELSKYYGVKVKSFPDDDIHNLGLTRQKILEWLYEEGIYETIMLDDDVLKLSYLTRGKTSKGTLVSTVPNKSYQDNTTVINSLKIWQLISERAIEKFNVMATAISTIGSAWTLGNTDLDKSFILMRCPLHQCMFLNVKGIIDNHLGFRDSVICEHEDLDFVITTVEKKFYVGIVPIVSFAAEDSNPGFNDAGESDLHKRFLRQQLKVKENFAHIDWISHRNKEHGLAATFVNWTRVRKNFGIKDNYRFNLLKEEEYDV